MPRRLLPSFSCLAVIALGAIAAPARAQLRFPQPLPQVDWSAAIQVDPAVQAKKLIYRVSPVYPHRALDCRIQGTVVLRALIGVYGRVEDLRYVSGPYLLAQASMDAVSQWRYGPTVRNGVLVAVQTLVMVSFRLPGMPVGERPAAYAGLPQRPEARGQANPDPVAQIIEEPDYAMRLYRWVEPIYPAEAKKKGIEGTVVLRIIIGKDGHVRAMRRISGNPILAAAAERAVRQSVYERKVVGCELVEVETVVSVVFTLHGLAGAPPVPKKNP
jgi:TonB family protein